jgi:ATP-dependent exoDNAse (exonuclease V) alpha subunit
LSRWDGDDSRWGRQTSTINLSGNQYIDYAWVSTTYSSQGKTAERVLALLGETTNREAFYVAISRAKRAVTLYTTSQADWCDWPRCRGPRRT